MRYFLLMWDCNGLECLQDITEYHPDQWDRDQLLGVIKGRKYKAAPIHQQIHQMIMRARFNTQRHYEIYVQQTDDGITAEEFSAVFNANPQHWADWIREHHSVKLWDDRAKIKPAIV